MKTIISQQPIINTIRERRMELTYSQEYMAAKMNVKQNCYSKIELGKSKLTVERLLRIANLLSLDPGHLLNARLVILPIKQQ